MTSESQTELSKSMEEYLKIAHELETETGSAAASDIAERLGVKAPSVTSALRQCVVKHLMHFHWNV